MPDWLVTIICSFIAFGGSIIVCKLNINANERKNKVEEKERFDNALREIQEESRRGDLEAKQMIAKSLSELQGIVTELKATNQMSIALIEERLAEQSRKIEVHNNVVERTYDLEKIAVQYGEVQRHMDQRFEELRINQNNLQKNMMELQNNLLKGNR